MRISLATYIGRTPRLAAVALVLLAGCGGGAKERTPPGPLTVYASLPAHGVEASAAAAVAAGAKLALADARGRAGGRNVHLRVLDDSDPSGGPTWDPDKVQANAAQAVADPSTIAYIGELNQGGSAVSVPVTNAAGLLQLSPLDGLTTLTREQPGAATGTGPARYYPSGRRTFLRLVPPDSLQANTLIRWIREEGAHQLTIVQDEEVFGRVLAQQAAVAAERAGMTVTSIDEPHDDPATYPDFARKLALKRPEAILYTGIGDAASGPLLGAIERAAPGAPLYGSSALVSARPVPRVLPDVRVVSPLLPASRYGPRARRLLTRITPKPDPGIAAAALYGYESMRVVLDSIAAAAPDPGDRPKVARAALASGGRDSAIGHYVVLRSGDVSTVRFGAYRLSAGALQFLGERPAIR